MPRKYHKSNLQKELRLYLKHKYYTKVYAEINGTPMYLNEYEVRFLQVKCKIAAEAGKFDEFVNNTIIYNGPRKRDSIPMIFRKDGKFANEFKQGFFNTSCDLAFKLL